MPPREEKNPFTTRMIVLSCSYVWSMHVDISVTCAMGRVTLFLFSLMWRHIRMPIVVLYAILFSAGVFIFIFTNSFVVGLRRGFGAWAWMPSKIIAITFFRHWILLSLSLMACGTICYRIYHSAIYIRREIPYSHSYGFITISSIPFVFVILVSSVFFFLFRQTSCRQQTFDKRLMLIAPCDWCAHHRKSDGLDCKLNWMQAT